MVAWVSKRVLFVSVVMTVLGYSRELPSPEGAFVKEQSSRSQEARIVFYRVSGDKKNIATVKIDDRVVGSLSPGHYTQAVACPGMIRAGVAQRWAVVDTTRYLDPMKVESSQDVYFQVNETADGHFSLTNIDAQSAHNDLSSLELGSNVLNRYAPKCTSPAVVTPIPAPIVVAPVVEPSTPVLLKTVDLSADALFPFDSSHFKPAGRIKLDNFVQEIQANTLHIEKLRISGYTDRLGSDSYNQKLSEQRAQRVADYLREKGIAIVMEVVGRGESLPVTSGCAKELPHKKLIECLQPDRRVSIDLIGFEKPSIEVK